MRQCLSLCLALSGLGCQWLIGYEETKASPQVVPAEDASHDTGAAGTAGAGLDGGAGQGNAGTSGKGGEDSGVDATLDQGAAGAAGGEAGPTCPDPVAVPCFVQCPDIKMAACGDDKWCDRPCKGDNSCVSQTITCNQDCRIACEGTSSCSGATVIGTGNANIVLECFGTSSCAGIKVRVESGSLVVDCGASTNACAGTQVTCGERPCEIKNCRPGETQTIDSSKTCEFKRGPNC